MAILLDTNIAIHLRDRNREVGERLAAWRSPKFLSLVTVVELVGGVAAASTLARQRCAALDRLLDVLTVLPLDREVVSRYAAILTATGFSRPRILDRLIAATAVVHGLTLVTVNAPDFQDVPDLKLEVWPTPVQ